MAHDASDDRLNVPTCDPVCECVMGRWLARWLLGGGRMGGMAAGCWLVAANLAREGWVSNFAISSGKLVAALYSRPQVRICRESLLTPPGIAGQS
eukprot:CAMPEP_0198368224 /NCGR_PEP_ID=MMETSP1450-20131203/155592_1 /TAXON_ID=753684 ORGANISM="Madagascaria erythrocladiodes, Strain CCMP3234" /NCGR_SAMPLE_ID=MMETSP1450 /ASSEMBLY_ACC=CAM_ASM_001115 /LENGTH=94 /DNA_ID=CAMNT_0044075725 /DNA_START=883 /DNA_END=1163 /DNA_ORIENTATION=+